jgi:2-octaprenyl-6-methoxyphenol hydroxylase
VLLDVAIIGAGPVGATLAASLASQGVSVEVFEARTAPSSDARVLALSQASAEQLRELRAWPSGDSTPILSIHVSQKAGPGRTLLEAHDAGLAALGHTVALPALEGALARRLAELAVRVHYASACESIELHPDQATLRFGSGSTSSARLLVLADGGANVSRIPGLAFVEKDYRQHAVTGLVRADRTHGARAYERFTTQGPAALLPFQDRFAFVWTASFDAAERLRQLPEPEFLRELQAHFGDRAGRFVEVTARAAFPLRLRKVNAPIALRTAVVGSAAQALHPIAGQGLNLGLRDARDLAAIVARHAGDDPGGADCLDEYRRSRRRDAARGIVFTDFLVSAFGLDGALPRLVRGFALTALDLFPPARRALASRMIHGAGQ